MMRIAALFACLAFAGGAFADDDIAITASFRLGGNVRITEAVDGPLHAAGGDVTLEAPVNGSVHIAGGKVALGSAAVVSGDASLAGGSVTVGGSIKGELAAAGGKVRIDGPVTGDVSVAAGTLELGPDARIQGKLTFRGGELRRDPAAQVAGGIDQSHRSWRVHDHTWAGRLAHGWMWIPVAMLFAALLAAAFPGASDRMAQELRERPWITPLVGLVALTTIPVAAVLLMVTIIGIPLGLLALMVYGLLLFVAYVWVAVVVGGMLLDRVKPETAARAAWRTGAAVLAMLVLAVLVRVPFVGGTIKLAALVVGLGMIVAAVFRRRHPVEAQPA
ncbi:MAG TPA: polymer-forming cytoskeletal protein [Usitatibacter sp.]|nr:polymer-forming cytoskeletal protein [Usitatibacter sp.]